MSTRTEIMIEEKIPEVMQACFNFLDCGPDVPDSGMSYEKGMQKALKLIKQILKEQRKEQHPEAFADFRSGVVDTMTLYMKILKHKDPSAYVEDLIERGWSNNGEDFTEE